MTVSKKAEERGPGRADYQRLDNVTEEQIEHWKTQDGYADLELSRARKKRPERKA